MALTIASGWYIIIEKNDRFEEVLSTLSNSPVITCVFALHISNSVVPLSPTKQQRDISHTCTPHLHSPGISLRPFIVGFQLASRPSSGEPFRSLMRSASPRNILCRSIKQNTGVTCKCLYEAKSFLCYRKALCIVWHIGLTPPQRLRHVTYYRMQKRTVQVFF
jgi:hypothetical protein